MHGENLELKYIIYIWYYLLHISAIFVYCLHPAWWKPSQNSQNIHIPKHAVIISFRTGRPILYPFNVCATSGFKVLIAAVLKSQVFWDVTLCRWPFGVRRVEGSWCLLMQGRAIEVSGAKPTFHSVSRLWPSSLRRRRQYTVMTHRSRSQ